MEGTENTQAQVQNEQNQGNTSQNAQAVTFDYDKLAQIINGRTQSAEESALKGYFKQQGLTQEEMEQAISSFKEQKKANTPNVEDLQARLLASERANRDMLVNNAATQSALSLGIDVKTAPYVIKLADLSNVVSEEGKIDDEKLTEALKKVLEDVPAFKMQSASNGFVQIGAGTHGKGSASETDATLDMIFGVKK